MSSRSTDALFQLIHSLEKSEKRSFKLYIKRNSGKNDLKAITLFDALDRQNEYDEQALLRRNESIAKRQLPNLKAHLYRQILISLRLLYSNSNMEMHYREQMDFAKILYYKGLYNQSLRIYEKVKGDIKANQQLEQLITVLKEEKRIEALHITRSIEDRAIELTTEVETTIKCLEREAKLSNLALNLYGWYIKNGMARNRHDEQEVAHYFKMNMVGDIKHPKGFYELMYYYQCYCWYAFIRQDYLMYYRYAQKWVDVFDDHPDMLELETDNFIKGIHNLLNSHFYLRNFKGFNQALKKFEQFSESDIVKQNNNNNAQVFVYLYTAKINKHFLEGTFNSGLELVDYIIHQLDKYELFLDMHRSLVFHYKIASLYFGAGDFDNAIEHLNIIINWKVNLRNDLQAYARLLHLISHYELGNYRLVEYLVKSVYRFMSKMNNLGQVEESVFQFLRSAFKLKRDEVKPELENLLKKLKSFRKSKFEARSFAYLDIISWLESKVYDKPVKKIIREKFLAKKRF